MSDRWKPTLPHIVQLFEGKLATGKPVASSLDHIFAAPLDSYVAQTRAKHKTPRLVFFAHGGLVDEATGLSEAQKYTKFWLDNDVFPVYVVWDTGVLTTLRSTLLGPDRLRFGLRREIAAWAVEILVRELHERKHLALWTRMKDWAAASVGVDGGAAVAADALVLARQRHPDLALHAIGHSAGAILHSHFLPYCLGLDPDIAFESLHLLAPAITVREFRERLFPLLGRGINSTSVFTMRDGDELDDICEVGGVTLYVHSLLYLIYHSLEAAPQTPILGLASSLNSVRETPLEVRRALGLVNGPSSRGEVIFGPTAAAGGKSSTTAIHHGDFDNNRPTMESVVRRIIGASDTDPIAPFPTEEARVLTPAGRSSFGLSTTRTMPALSPDTSVDPLALELTNPTPEQLSAARALRDALDAYLAAFDTA